MQNVTVSVKDGKLTIAVDLGADLGISKSGKSRLIASTFGNVPIPGSDARLGLNVYRPITRG